MKEKLLVLVCAMFLLATQAFAQQKVITGKVTDSDDGGPLPGVSVRVKGGTSGVQTNNDGAYSISVNVGEVLIFSYISMDAQEIKVATANTINVSLKSSNQNLQEVVVVGFGTQKKANLTGAVSTIDTKVMDSRPVTDVARALQGTTPGLTITSSSGAIGQSPQIKLRGNVGSLTGTGGASPLILVDNVEIPDLQLVNPEDIESISVLKDAASASIYGTRAAWGVILITTKTGKKNTPAKVSYSNNVAFSTPTTTPEIAPAADGAEMAFSARRRFTPGESVFTFVGINVDDIAIQKMREWETLYGGKDLGSEMVLDRDYEIRGGKLFFYRPWDVDEMYVRQWVPQQKHDISITGGSEKTTYNIGVGYLGQEGVLKVNPDEFSRYNLNLGVTTAVTDWFDARAKVLYTNTKTSEPFNFASAVYDPWYYLYRWPKVFPYGTINGQPFRNAITDVTQTKMSTNTNSLSRISLGGTLKPFAGFTIDADYTFTGVNGHDNQTGGVLTGLDFWSGVDAQGQIPFRAYSSPSYNLARYTSNWSTLNTGKVFATYNKNIEDHAFKVIAGGDIESYDRVYQLSERRDLIDLNAGEVNLATGDQFATSTHARWNTLGVFGRINYAYKDKYLLEINGRYDGSSSLSPNKKWGFFPSASAGYIITEESFMEFSKPVLSFLKFRASYGEIGNQNTIPSNIYSVLPTSNSGWLIGGKNILTVGSPKPISGALTWETVSTLDFGVDARFFDSKFGASFDWYKRTTSDMHTPGTTLPAVYGAVPPTRNFGTLKTTGWELAVDYRHAFGNGLNLNLSGVLSDYREVLVDYEGARAISGNYKGKVLGEIWGYETDRFFTKDDFVQDASGNPVLTAGKYTLKDGTPNQTQFEGNNFFYGPGDIKYKDLNGDGVITRGSNTVEDPGDQKVIGNSTPRYQYGFRIGADFKGFDFNMFFQGVGSRDYWAQGPMFVPGWRTGEAWYAHQLDYWTEENTDAYYPRPTNMAESSTKNFYPQSKYLLDLSYLRLKNVTLGYAIPKNVVEKIHLSRLRFYVSGENLFEMDKLKNIPIDPEVNVTENGKNDPAAFGRVYPYRRTISFGLQATF